MTPIIGAIDKLSGVRWVLLPAVLLTGCYGGKIVRMPINTDLTSKRLDTLQTRQEAILEELADLNLTLREEREERIREKADTSLRLEEMERSLEILVNKVDDTMQLMERLRFGGTRERPPARVDTVSMSVARPESAEAKRAPADDEKLYQASLMDLTRGNYELAIQGFRNYLKAFPSGGRSAEVHYYLGECYFSSERYLDALGEYQTVIKEFTDSRLVPSAYLKAGMCYSSMEEPALAEKSFRELISKFPHSEEAEHAKAALKELGG